jgi:hypothetical protein
MKNNYQNKFNAIFFEVFKGKLKKCDVADIAFVGIPSLNVICLIKNNARPYRKFLNSINTTPPLILVHQHSSFPFPFPIRTPSGFLVKGKCGKAKNQIKRRVLSDFFAARFKNNLNRNN